MIKQAILYLTCFFFYDNIRIYEFKKRINEIYEKINERISTGNISFASGQ